MSPHKDNSVMGQILDSAFKIASIRTLFSRYPSLSCVFYLNIVHQLLQPMNTKAPYSAIILMDSKDIYSGRVCSCESKQARRLREMNMRFHANEKRIANLLRQKLSREKIHSRPCISLHSKYLPKISKSKPLYFILFLYHNKQPVKFLTRSTSE